MKYGHNSQTRQSCNYSTGNKKKKGRLRPRLPKFSVLPLRTEPHPLLRGCSGNRFRVLGVEYRRRPARSEGMRPANGHPLCVCPPTLVSGL